jgi:tRNA nucleotidyltransferase/poly(A) polymerase
MDEIKSALDTLNVKFYTIKLYQVGGCVRDDLIGVKSNDIDYSVVIESKNQNQVIDIAKGLEFLEAHLVANGYTIFLKTPETFTFKAKNNKTGEIADFVLARHEIGYEQSSRKPQVVLGTLAQDLARRDFTINAMARDEFGNLIDLFDGQADLANGILRTPLDPTETFLDDPLRLFRALRFAVTKQMEWDHSLWAGLTNPDIYDKLWRVVSAERVREELHKMFSHDSEKSLKLLVEFSGKIKSVSPTFLSDCFSKTGLWLKPTNEKVKKL